MKRRTQISISAALIVGYFVLFSGWEYTTDLYRYEDVGRRVSFSEPMVVYTFVPKSIAGSAISSKYNATIVTQNDDVYRRHLKYSNEINKNIDEVYEVTKAIQVNVLGLIHNSFKSPIVYYILKDQEGRLLPIQSGLFHGLEKTYY